MRPWPWTSWPDPLSKLGPGGEKMSEIAILFIAKGLGLKGCYASIIVHRPYKAAASNSGLVFQFIVYLQECMLVPFPMRSPWKLDTTSDLLDSATDSMT